MIESVMIESVMIESVMPPVPLVHSVKTSSEPACDVLESHTCSHQPLSLFINREHVGFGDVGFAGQRVLPFVPRLDAPAEPLRIGHA